MRTLRRQRAKRTPADHARVAEADRNLVHWIRDAGIREWQSLTQRSADDRLTPREISERTHTQETQETPEAALPESVESISGVLATNDGRNSVAETTIPINGASERFYVREFGAVGDGITDDTMAIQRP